MKRKNYYLHKDLKTGEILYFEYDKIKGFPVTPKTKIEDAIDVHKIIFVNPTLQEKLLRKKVEVKLRGFYHLLEEFNDDGGSRGEIQATIMQAEHLKLNILTRDVHYFGNTYANFSMSQLQMIVRQLRVCLYQAMQREHYQSLLKQQMTDDLYYLDEEQNEKGRGR